MACPPYPPSRSRRLKAQRLHRDSSCVPKEKKHNLSSSVSESCPTSFLGYITSFLSDLYAIATNKMNASWIWFFQIITCGNQLLILFLMVERTPIVWWKPNDVPIICVKPWPIKPSLADRSTYPQTYCLPHEKSFSGWFTYVWCTCTHV